MVKGVGGRNVLFFIQYIFFLFYKIYEEGGGGAFVSASLAAAAAASSAAFAFNSCAFSKSHLSFALTTFDWIYNDPPFVASLAPKR
jgi:hypothetical protein